MCFAWKDRPGLKYRIDSHVPNQMTVDQCWPPPRDVGLAKDRDSSVLPSAHPKGRQAAGAEPPGPACSAKLPGKKKTRNKISFLFTDSVVI